MEATVIGGLAPKLYTIQAIPGKGLGFIATKKIVKGTRITAEKPIFTISKLVSLEHGQQQIADMVVKLSKENQTAFLSLHNNFKGVLPPLIGIVKTNALPLGPTEDIMEGGVFLELSRVNHSCCPNSYDSWNANTEKRTLHAIRDINEGEEITIRYKDGTFKSRQRELKRAFGFNCDCNTCSLPDAEQKIKDTRLEEMDRLFDSISDPFRRVNYPEKVVSNLHALLTLYQAENIADVRVEQLYYDAFQMVRGFGDLARARVFAERMHAASLCCEGEDSPVTLMAKAIAKDPAHHLPVGARKEWEQSVKQIPRNLASDEFEAWLWARMG
jgi:hypothetical protein